MMYVCTCPSKSGMSLIDMRVHSCIGDAQTWRDVHCACIFLVMLISWYWKSMNIHDGGMQYTLDLRIKKQVEVVHKGWCCYYTFLSSDILFLL